MRTDLPESQEVENPGLVGPLQAPLRIRVPSSFDSHSHKAEALLVITFTF